MPLSLELPAPDPKLAAIVETDAKALRQWLIAISGSNVAESGRQIHDALASVNRVPLEADVRLKLLDEYRSTLDVMAGEFAARSASQGMPMRDKARQASLLLRALLLELAIGYKLALVDRIERRSFFSSNTKQVPYLVQQILLLHYRIYQISCHMAMPLPAGMWRETHTLFRHVAEARQLDEPHGEDAGPPVAVIYKRILLLALADPLRFSAMELDKVIEIIDNYAPAAHFQPLSHLASSGGFFFWCNWKPTCHRIFFRQPHARGNRRRNHAGRYHRAGQKAAQDAAQPGSESAGGGRSRQDPVLDGCGATLAQAVEHCAAAGIPAHS